jgi:hypothetical protein
MQAVNTRSFFPAVVFLADGLKPLLNDDLTFAPRIGASGQRSPKVMILRSAKLLIVIVVAFAVPVGAQPLKKVPDANQLSCGQKALVEDNTCPTDEILQVTGSCIGKTGAVDAVLSERGTQYNCIKRTQGASSHSVPPASAR